MTIVVFQFAPTAAISSDVKPFSRYELYLYISEKTQIRTEGKVFYSDAGTLQTRWQGRCLKGRWSTTDEGLLCRHVSVWEADACETYYHDGDGVSIVTDGVVSGAPELEKGNTIDCHALDLTLSMAQSSPEEPIGGLLSRNQTIEFLSGKTAIWGPERGLYYAPDFTLIKTWDGVRSQGRWSVNEKGAVRWEIPGWGPTPCESYYYKGEVLMSVFNQRHQQAFDITYNHMRAHISAPPSPRMSNGVIFPVLIIPG